MQSRLLRATLVVASFGAIEFSIQAAETPAGLVVLPASFDEHLSTAETTTRPLTLHNQGGSPLTFSIAIEHVPAAGRGVEPPPAGDAVAELALPSWRYDAGQAPSRGPYPARSTKSAAAAPALEVLILQSGGDVAEIRALLLEFPEISSVDVFDAQMATPTLEDLIGHHAVLVASNFPFEDPAGVGDVLADYVDAGGGVVQTLASFVSGWSVSGRFLHGGYSPFELGVGPLGSDSLGEYDPGHPIMSGVTAVWADLLAYAPLASGSQWVASWDGGLPFLATQGHRVVGANVYVLASGYWTGDVPLILRNALLWSAGIRWLSVEPVSGVLAAGEKTEISVTFDATGLGSGEYAAVLVVTSDDPDEPEIRIPVRLHVRGIPDLEISPASLDFGPVFKGASAVAAVTVANGGTGVLTISSVTFDDQSFAADVTSFTLAVGESRGITVTFTPDTHGPKSATMTIASDDPSEGEGRVALQGMGVIPPDIAVSPRSFDERLHTGETVTTTVTIENSGESDLDFEISVRGVSEPAAASSRESVSGVYTGTHLTFGISDHGEVMPFQSPAGNEHLAVGTWLSGHTVAYVADGEDRVCYATYYQRSCLQPVSYREIRNTESVVEVEVVSHTWDGYLQITQTVTFRKATRYVVLEAELRNLGGAEVSDVVFKWVADWDVDEDYQNTWDYDRSRDMVLAWNSTYVAVAGIEPPAHMDLDGWDDCHRRGTEVDYPTGPVTFDGAALLHFDVGSLSPGVSRAVGIVYGAAPDLPSLRTAIDEGRASARWLTTDVRHGRVPPGSSRDVQVTFDATGLFGGGYDALLEVSSNDPDEARVTIPAHLHVTGAPDVVVTPASVDYGPVFKGTASTRTVTVANAGTDVLAVSSLTFDHDDFTADASSFTLQVGESRELAVTFAPSAPLPASARMAIASDDPDEPVVTVHLQGQGVVPPEIQVSPASFAEGLFTGETVIRMLTVENSGGSELTFEMEVRPVPSRGDAARVLLVKDVSPWGSNANETVLVASGLAFDTVGSAALPTVDLRSYGHIIVASDQPTPFYDTYSANRARIESWVSSGGVLEFHAAGWGHAGGDPSLVILPGGMRIHRHLADVNHVLAPGHPLAAGVPNPFTGSYASHAYFTAVPASATVVASDDLARPSLVVYRHGLGTVVSGGQTFEYQYPLHDAGRILVNMIPWAGEQASSWLSLDPVEGVVPAGAAVEVAVRFDASRLIGGDYRAAIAVSSNDPHEPSLTVPVELRVTGAPDVGVSPASIDYGSLFVGASASATVTVENTGTDVLAVSSLTFDHGDFTADASSFTLPVGESRELTVTFTPSLPGMASATMTLASNDLDSPQVWVALLGEGLVAPDLAVSPETFGESLLTGQMVTRTLTVENSGGSDLTFDLSRRASPDEERVLLVRDLPPWDRTANEAILSSLGIPFDTVGSAALSTVDLGIYGHVVVASDQPTGFYAAFAAQKARIDSWVHAGGVLEFHAAGWGWQGGDASLVTLPAGMHTQRRVAYMNRVLAPAHPLASGVFDPIDGESLSYFTDIPAGATLIASDALGFPTLVVYRHGAGTVVASGQALEYYYPGGPMGRILANTIPWAHEQAAGSWLSLDPRNGVVPPGQAAQVAVTFDATGLIGGDYVATIAVSSNDPDEPEVPVPVSLHVTGAPDLDVSPPALDYGALFVGASSTKMVTLTNRGTDVLTVTSVTFDHGDFTADASSFTLAAGEIRELAVTFAPAALGPVEATLTIASDDPDEPSLAVALRGEGRFAPQIVVSPASLTASLFTGQTATRTMTVGNTGGHPLAFRAGQRAVTPSPLIHRVLVLRDVPPFGSNANETILSAHGIPFDTVGSPGLATVDLGRYRHILVASDQTTSFYTALAAQKSRIDAWVSAGGLLEFHAAGWDAFLVVLPGGARSQFRYVEQNFVLAPEHPLVAGIPSPLVGNPASLAFLAGLPLDATVIASDPFGSPTLVTYRHGLGVVLAGGQPFEYSFGDPFPFQIVANMIPWAHDLATSWLSVWMEGVLAPGASTEVSVGLDASGLPSGEYVRQIVVTSNDPAQPEVVLPVSLHVTAAPDVEVSPAALDFGTVFVGAASMGTVTVENAGADVLTVSGVTFDHPDLTANASSFTLAAGERRALTLTFAPSAPGPVEAAMTVTSDDPDEGQVTVALTGRAVTYPDVGLDPPSMHEVLPPGGLSTHVLSLTNPGGTDLIFQITGGPGLAGQEPPPLPLLLVTAGADVAVLQQQLAQFPDLAAVDVFDAGSSTPVLAELSSYGAVILISSLQPFANAEALGDVLADYVDLGGGVILTFASILDGWEVKGRFGEAYRPFTLATSLFEPEPLGSFDAAHPIFRGVSSAVGFPSDVGLAPGAVLVGSWSGGRPFVATRGSRVVGANIYLASEGTWQGDVALILRNAALWSAGVLPDWVQVVPRTGVVPPGGSLPLTVTFDAAGLPEGVQGSTFVVESNDPDEPALEFPVTLTVTAARGEAATVGEGHLKAGRPPPAPAPPSRLRSSWGAPPPRLRWPAAHPGS